mgnify:FL=1
MQMDKGKVSADNGLHFPLPTSRTDIVEAVANWCEALAGNLEIDEALAGLVRGVGAEAGMLVRTQAGGTVKVAVHDRLARSVARPLCRSFAEGEFGENLSRSRGGAIWFASTDSENELPSDPALAEWQESRGMSEFAVVVLLGSTLGRDRIELHFRDLLTTADQAKLALVASTVARTWANRQVGVISGSIIAQRHPDTRRANTLPILGIANPARLSRAEFRVCLLLSRGLAVAGIVAELGLSEATVRSHLRSIYAKIGVSGLPQLVYRLIISRTPLEPELRRASNYQ